MRLFLDVPYAEKDEAKKLGAKWNPKVKKWYTDSPREKYLKFSKWLLKDTDDAFIATENIFLVEGQQKCWKCGNTTKVIGLGLYEGVHIYGDIDESQYELIESETDPGAELHLSWVDSEDDIPPKLLQYIKENYSVKTGYSKTIGGKCFANHCDCCGALQGNWFLFDEPDSPLSSCIGGNELIERMSNLKIYCIPIDDDLQLNWNIGICSNDYAYFEYGKFEDLILSSNPQNICVSYEELYNIR